MWDIHMWGVKKKNKCEKLMKWIKGNIMHEKQKKQQKNRQKKKSIPKSREMRWINNKKITCGKIKRHDVQTNMGH